MPLTRMKNAQAKLKRLKNAQKNLDADLQIYYRHYGSCEQLADDVKEKFAERSSASLDAIITLGQVATFMRQIPLANKVNTGPSDVTPGEIADWQNRSKIAADLIQTLGSFGFGAAGISGLWAAAGKWGAALNWRCNIKVERRVRNYRHTGVVGRWRGCLRRRWNVARRGSVRRRSRCP